MCRITNAMKGLPSVINKAQDRKEIIRYDNISGEYARK